MTGNQLTGESSIDAYINALKLGCRCVERKYTFYIYIIYIFLFTFLVDCWDGSDGEPIIYHGHTLTTQIQFKDVVKACKNYAFEKTKFPLIFSIENHCSVEQQDKMADHLINILGDLLFVHNIQDSLGPTKLSEYELPSPYKLRNKVLIKAKRLPPNSESNDVIEVDGPNDDDDVDEVRKTKPKKISQKLSDLVNYIHAVHFPGFENKDAKFYHMSSFGESKTQKIIDDPELAVKFVKYNTKQISRIYPGASRQDSSNLHPIDPWTAGCQIGSNCNKKS